MITKAFFIILLIFYPLYGLSANDPQPLPVNQAFKMSVNAVNPQMIAVEWQIQPGYYLYQNRIHFSPAPKNAAVLGKPAFPPGIQKSDLILGHYIIYENTLKINIPVSEVTSSPLKLKINYQGCSEEGFCYPPVEKTVAITGLNRQSVSWIFWFGLLGAGVLIAFTPCVLPMVPILSSLIIGKEQMSHGRAFLISAAYVLGMALTYALIGLLFGWLGSSLQVLAQKPLVIGLFCLIFFLMALSLFGFFHVEPPEKIRNLMAKWTHVQHQGSVWGAGLMGILSTLILSPCATPPLVAALSFITQKGEPILGAIALLVMGIGMGIPLLIIGLVGRRFLPKPGPWMDWTKKFLGIILVALAIWMLSRVIETRFILLLWAALMIGVSVALKTFSTTPTVAQKISKSCGIILFVSGVLLIASSIQQGNKQCNYPSSTAFIPVKTVSDIQKQFALAPQKLFILDFYADWCVSCKILERQVFANQQVQQNMADIVWLRADITANDQQDQELLNVYQVVAPPTILFFDHQHQEVGNLKVVGEISPENFIKKLEALRGGLFY